MKFLKKNLVLFLLPLQGNKTENERQPLLSEVLLKSKSCKYRNEIFFVVNKNRNCIEVNSDIFQMIRGQNTSWR